VTIADPRRLARRSAETLRAGGARALLWQVLAYLGVRRLEIHCRQTDRETVTPVHAVPGVTVRALGPDDAPSHGALRPRPEIDAVEFRRRLRAGSRCFGAWRGRRLIAVHWLALGEAPLPYLGVLLPLGPGVCFDFEAYTAPEERRRGISNLLAGAVRAEALASGKPQILSALLPENRVSVGIVTVRSSKIGTVASLRVGRWRLARSSVPAVCMGRPLVLQRTG
jgi:hypothetical protein